MAHVRQETFYFKASTSLKSEPVFTIIHLWHLSFPSIGIDILTSEVRNVEMEFKNQKYNFNLPSKILVYQNCMSF